MGATAPNLKAHHRVASALVVGGAMAALVPLAPLGLIWNAAQPLLWGVAGGVCGGIVASKI